MLNALPLVFSIALALPQPIAQADWPSPGHVCRGMNDGAAPMRSQELWLGRDPRARARIATLRQLLNLALDEGSPVPDEVTRELSALGWPTIIQCYY
jgi:hypothetical protein